MTNMSDVTSSQAATLSATAVLNDASKNLAALTSDMQERLRTPSPVPFADVIALTRLQVDFARALIALAERL